MVLFMEGGCDWGASNIFFYSKLGLLLGINFSFVVAAGLPRLSPLTFLPHLLLLAALGFFLRSDADCDFYYSHPNGSLGQMALEAAAFAILGMALLPKVRGRSIRVVLTGLGWWNAAHIGLFYAWLSQTNHWTWRHTALLSLSMVALAILVALVRTDRKQPAHCRP